MSLNLAALPMSIWSGCGAFDSKPLHKIIYQRTIQFSGGVNNHLAWWSRPADPVVVHDLNEVLCISGRGCNGHMVIGSGIKNVVDMEVMSPLVGPSDTINVDLMVKV